MKFKFSSNFIFAVCQVGAVGALKKELAREHPALKFAFSRPGFLTFKDTSLNEDQDIPADFSLHSVFARAYGVSLGEIKQGEISKVIDFAKELFQSHGQSADPSRNTKKIRLHVWERDFHIPGEEPLGFVPGALATQLEKKVRKEGSQYFEESTIALARDWVLDLIVLEEDKYWLGMHLHSAQHSVWPGGRPGIHLPADAPSRAYLKLEEAVLWSNAPLKAGDIAVEIGSAPGGASFALLNRGLKVVGIDPGEMDRRVLKNPLFLHFQQPVNSVLREDLPESVQWVLLDMNVEPRISLFAVDRLVSRMKDSLLGVFLTIKLNQWKIAEEIPEMLEHIRAMGMIKIKAAQLASNRQEIIIFGLTRKGMTRK